MPHVVCRMLFNVPACIVVCCSAAVQWLFPVVEDMYSADFFAQSYTALRAPYAPMKWMERMFAEIVDGNAPSLVDLPTGTARSRTPVRTFIASTDSNSTNESRDMVPFESR